MPFLSHTATNNAVAFDPSVAVGPVVDAAVSAVAAGGALFIIGYGVVLCYRMLSGRLGGYSSGISAGYTQEEWDDELADIAESEARNNSALGLDKDGNDLWAGFEDEKSDVPFDKPAGEPIAAGHGVYVDRDESEALWASTFDTDEEFQEFKRTQEERMSAAEVVSATAPGTDSADTELVESAARWNISEQEIAAARAYRETPEYAADVEAQIAERERKPSPSDDIPF
jgi:hypothetical protein